MRLGEAVELSAALTPRAAVILGTCLAGLVAGHALLASPVLVLGKTAV